MIQPTYLLKGSIRGCGLREPIDVVHVVVLGAVVVQRVHRDRLLVQLTVVAERVHSVRRAVPAGDVGVVAHHAAPVERFGTHNINRVVAVGTRTEVGRFVHVQPEPIKWHDLLELGNLSCPPFLGFRVEEVGEVDRTWPHLAEVLVAVGCAHEDVQFFSPSVWWVALVHFDPCKK